MKIFLNLGEMVPKEISLTFTLKTYLYQHSLMILLILVKD